MAEYELVHEIKNLCRNNQMRDIFFEEVECDDPETYLRNRLQGKQVELTPQVDAVIMPIHARVDGMRDTYVFTPR